MKICVGISGSIAAYRSVDFVKKLTEAGHQVRCVLTAGGREFVSARALETFSAFPVQGADVFDASHFSTDHISTARWAEAFVVYGASANFLGRFSSAIADDFLNLQLLAFEGPVILAPAMNPSMWKNSMVQSAVKKLSSSGYTFVGPIGGKVACGETGVGHIASDEEIINALMSKSASNQDLSLEGQRVLISAGPMQTQLDPVRYIQNRSSGKMGLSLADACRKAGASVHVLLGPVSDSMVERFAEICQLTRYLGPEDYQKSLDHLFTKSDIFFSAAAVLDFEGVPPKKKIERSALSEAGQLSLKIKSVPDIVSYYGSKKSQSQKVIAFAAETGTEAEIVERAHKKMLNKSADAMIANPVWPGLGPDSDENLIWILRPGQEAKKIGPAPKSELGFQIIKALFPKQAKSAL